MKIFVCVRQVPDTETKIRTGAAGLETAGVKWVVNPYDEYAIEEALKLKASTAGATVTAVSVGPKTRVVDALRTALAMGADEATVIDSPENLDNLTIAKALSGYLKAEDPGIVFAGKVAIDDGSMATPQMLAELLGFPHATVVSKFAIEAGKALVERDVEGGSREVIELTLPAVIAANKGLNTPRYASLPGIMKAKKKTIKELSLSDVGTTADEVKTKFSNYQLPPDRPACKILGGGAPELARLLREEAKVI